MTIEKEALLFLLKAHRTLDASSEDSAKKLALALINEPAALSPVEAVKADILKGADSVLLPVAESLALGIISECLQSEEPVSNLEKLHDTLQSHVAPESTVKE